MRLKVKINSLLAQEYAYTWEIFARDAKVDFVYVEADEDLLISEEPHAGIRLSSRFRERYLAGETAFLHYFEKDPVHFCEDGSPDYLSTCFYLLSCLQEYGNPPLDRYNRFPFSSSFQSYYKCLEYNLVDDYFQRIYQLLPGQWPPFPLEKSRIFLSHDVDQLNHGWKEDGKYALGTGRVLQFVALLYRQFFGKPSWHNIEKVLEVDNEFKMLPTFFWLPVKGKAAEGRPPNADYDLKSRKVQQQIKVVLDAGHENGLHKSVASSTFAEEMAKLKGVASNMNIRANRFHFLQFRLPQAFDAIEAAGLEVDCSMGFPEEPGFRNAYGKPYQPYNIRERRPYRFVEVPLHFMDTTFRYYRESGATDMRRRFQAFMRRNGNNSVVSLLWHNNYYTSLAYRDYRKIYPEILFYLQKHSIRPIGISELIESGKHSTAAKAETV